MAKLLTQRASFELMDACLQIHGGAGYMKEVWVERAARDSRLGPIGGGSDEIMREILGRVLALCSSRTLGNGLQSCPNLSTRAHALAGRDRCRQGVSPPFPARRLALRRLPHGAATAARHCRSRTGAPAHHTAAHVHRRRADRAVRCAKTSSFHARGGHLRRKHQPPSCAELGHSGARADSSRRAGLPPRKRQRPATRSTRLEHATGRRGRLPRRRSATDAGKHRSGPRRHALPGQPGTDQPRRGRAAAQRAPAAGRPGPHREHGLRRLLRTRRAAAAIPRSAG